MDQAIVTGLAAIVGSVTGGLTTLTAGWLSQRAQGTRQTLRTLLDKRA
jgi:hypothetical protein